MPWKPPEMYVFSCFSVPLSVRFTIFICPTQFVPRFFIGDKKFEPAAKPAQVARGKQWLGFYELIIGI
jgi:hypothetical protein